MFPLAFVVGHYRVTDDALLAETTQYDPSSFFMNVFIALIFDFYLKKLSKITGPQNIHVGH